MPVMMAAVGSWLADPPQKDLRLFSAESRIGKWWANRLTD